MKRKAIIWIVAFLVVVSAFIVTVFAVNNSSTSNSSYVYNNTVAYTTVDGDTGWWYFVDHQPQKNFTGLCNYGNDYGWWYVKNGKVDFSVNTIAQNDYGWWKIQNGKVDFGYNGVAQNQYGWWYIKNGQVRFDFTGLGNYGNEYGWWYINNGKVTFNHNGIDQNNYGWWYVTNSQVQFNYTGVSNFCNNYGWWYINHGKVDFSKYSVEQNNYGWWYIEGGKVNFNYTGVSNYANDYGWWYLKNGKVDFSYNGTAKNKYGTWNVINGKVKFENETTSSATAVSSTTLPSYAAMYGWSGFPLWDYEEYGQFMGRLRIPSVGVNVALYYSNAQSTIDAVDSAGLFGWGQTPQTLVVADHNSQGFSKIMNCSVGTYLYIDGVDGITYTYVCDEVVRDGYNSGRGIYYSNGKLACNNKGLWCYTCNWGGESSITMVHFHAV